MSIFFVQDIYELFRKPAGMFKYSGEKMLLTVHWAEYLLASFHNKIDGWWIPQEAPSRKTETIFYQVSIINFNFFFRFRKGFKKVLSSVTCCQRKEVDLKNEENGPMKVKTILHEIALCPQAVKVKCSKQLNRTFILDATASLILPR